MSESKQRVRVLRQVEHGVLTKVENVNGVVTLLKELDRDNETSVAVAAAHCLRRVFSQLLDPAKNPQLPPPAPAPSTPAGGVSEGSGESGKEGTEGNKKKKSKKNKKKRAREEDDNDDDDGVSAVAAAVNGRGGGGGGGRDDGGGDDDRAARVYQGWLEARYLDFLRVLLGWVAEVDDFHRQGPALRTLMHFVEIEPSLCVTAAKCSTLGKMVGSSGGGTGGGGGGVVGAGDGEDGVSMSAVSGEGTIWGGLFAEIMRAVVLGPCSMEPRLLKVLGEGFVNVHDDVRYYLLGNVADTARSALADHKSSNPPQPQQHSAAAGKRDGGQQHTRLPAGSPLRGYHPGAAAAFTGSSGTVGKTVSGTVGKTVSGTVGKTVSGTVTGTVTGAVGGEETASSPSPGGKRAKKRKRGKAGEGGGNLEGGGGEGGTGAGSSVGGVVVGEAVGAGEGVGGGGGMGLAEIGGRLAQVLMVVRMVEEQSDLSAFLLPVRLSLPSAAAAGAFQGSGNHGVGGGGGGGTGGGDGDASSSDSDEEEEEEEEEEEGGRKGVSRTAGGGLGKGKGGGKGKGNGKVGAGGGGSTTGTGKKRLLAIERLRYHKKAFGDAWLACLRLPLPPALYRRVLLFLPGNVIPYMPSPVRLADFLTEAYTLGGAQSVLALDALFLLMQSHDLDYPNFYDSLYRLVTSDMMYAKYRARFFRMVDLCLSSSHVPAYVVAAFLKRFSRATLQAPPSGALFTLALVRKLIGRHPECLPLISSNASAVGKEGKPTRPNAASAGIQSGGGGAAAAAGGEVAGTENGRPLPGKAGVEGVGAGTGFVDEYDPACEGSKGAGAMRTSLWELAALQDHYHPAVATLARGFLREADKKEAEAEAFSGPSSLAGETYQSLFDQEMRRKMGKVALAFRRPKGLFDDVPEEGGGVFAALKLSL